MLLSLFLLAGCVYHAPDMPVPGQWRESEAFATLQCTAWPDDEWWRQFNSPQLTAMIEEARSNNFDIAAAVARVEQADASVRISGAPLLPSIGADGGASRARTPGVARSAVNNNYNAGLSASYEVDFWGKNLSGLRSAQALAQASRFDQETVTLTTVAGVANTYFSVLGAQDRLKVAHDNLAAAQNLLTAIRTRFDHGLNTSLDVAQQENVVATQQAAIPPIELLLRQNMDALAILLGRMPESVAKPAEGDGLANISAPQVLPGLPSELLTRRPDVQSAEAQLASAHANINVARAAFFPSISLTAERGYESNALASLFSPQSILWSLGASLTQPIFEGGLLVGNFELAKGRYEELLQDYRKSAVSAFSDVEDSLAAVAQGAALEQAQMDAERTAREAYELSQKQFQGGVVDITTVLNTQHALFSAEDALVQAKLTHLQAIVGLYRALGGGWEKQKETP